MWGDFGSNLDAIFVLLLTCPLLNYTFEGKTKLVSVIFSCHKSKGKYLLFPISRKSPRLSTATKILMKPSVL